MLLGERNMFMGGLKPVRLILMYEEILYSTKSRLQLK